MEQKDGVFYYYLLLFAFLHPHLDVCVSQDTSGFINIDCGSDTNSSYFDLQYSTDAGFIDSGENHNIPAEGITPGTVQQLLNLRSFPVGQRNCYNLSVATGRKGNKYLIKARFQYGNYDGKNQTPIFDLHLGVEKWDTIYDNTPKEIIHVPTSNYVYVCLVNTGNGIPFISALELRPLNPRAYSTNPQDSLQTVGHWYYAPHGSNQTIRYPDDLYDRRWSPFPTPTYWQELKTTSTIDNSNNIYLPPRPVLQSAVTPKDNNSNMFLNWNGEDPNRRFSFCFHFSEVEQHYQAREFDIYLNGVNLQPAGSIKLMNYGSTQSIYVDPENTRKNFNFTLQKSVGSLYPPVISGVERFVVIQVLQAQTDENDVFAMVNIKATYGLNKSNWQGDPCLPRDFLWEGLDCVTFDNQSTPPRIKYLDLSSSGVSGLITPYLSQLKSLEFLDLSDNKLSGPIPDFLAELPFLKVLNLSGNNFVGHVPRKLADKENNGLLLLRISDTDPTKKNGVQRESLVKIVGVPFAVFLPCLVIALFIICKKRIINPDGEVLGIPRQNDVDARDETEKFTMAQIKKMTKKFKNPIGKGGFGQVFRGTMTDGTEVAVKLLSSNSTQGHSQHEAEVKLLKRAPHQNLTPILGYGHEGNEMAIVYKYMPNGCLNKFLSPDSKQVLTWRQRLCIAFGATQGLQYLHDCNLIHRDVKPENILLDEKLEAKLGDFGLVRETKQNSSHVTTALQGTHGYVDPEYWEYDRLREKSDVFGIGVVLLRLITGQPLGVPVGNQVKHITQWLKDLDVKDDIQIREIVDPKLEGNFDLESVKKAFTLATKCAAPKSNSRSNMSEVVKELEECLKLARGQ